MNPKVIGSYTFKLFKEGDKNYLKKDLTTNKASWFLSKKIEEEKTKTQCNFPFNIEPLHRQFHYAILDIPLRGYYQLLN